MFGLLISQAAHFSVMMQQKACLLESRRAFLWLERAIVY